MTRGQVSDPEWKGSITTYVCYCLFCLLFAIFHKHFIYEPIIQAPAPDLSDVPAAYGFHMRGNLSFFSDEVMNRVDTNESSPTYGLWTPPPGASPPCEGQPRPCATPR